jgi:hypothetical protein
MLKDCRYGLYMGALFAPVSVLSQAIFPSNRSDDEAGGLILVAYLATFVYYGTAGFLGVRKSLQARELYCALNPRPEASRKTEKPTFGGLL